MKDNRPFVSVLVPVYNVEKYLKECLDSLVNQTLKNIEIVCVNECYFQMKHDSCHSTRPELLNTKVACKELIPKNCCFKLVEEGV